MRAALTSIWQLVVFCSSIVGDESSFIFTIEELHTLAMKMFFNSLSVHASKVLDKVSFYEVYIGIFFMITWKRILNI